MWEGGVRERCGRKDAGERSGRRGGVSKRGVMIIRGLAMTVSASVGMTRGCSFCHIQA